MLKYTIFIVFYHTFVSYMSSISTFSIFYALFLYYILCVEWILLMSESLASYFRIFWNILSFLLLSYIEYIININAKSPKKIARIFPLNLITLPLIAIIYSDEIVFDREISSLKTLGLPKNVFPIPFHPLSHYIW